MTERRHKNLELRIDLTKSIPRLDSSEEYFGYFSRITHVFPCQVDALQDRSTTLKKAKRIRIQIKHSGGSSGQVYSSEDFKRFLKEYNLSEPEYLINKPVIGVYTKRYGERLASLIPVNTGRLRI